MRGQTIAEIAKQHGKAVGVVTTVQWSDATPAGLGGAHNVSRNNYAEIANEMLDSGWLDVIMGAGNPDFDDDGRRLPATMKARLPVRRRQRNLAVAESGKRGWKLVENRADFDALAVGPTPPKVLGTAQVATTLQTVPTVGHRDELERKPLLG